MNDFKIKNKDGLELTVTNRYPEYYESIMGGINNPPSWKEYISDYPKELRPKFLLIKDAIKKLGWIGKTGEEISNNYCFIFSDGVSIGFSWRAWGDLMSALINKREGYMKYYM